MEADEGTLSLTPRVPRLATPWLGMPASSIRCLRAGSSPTMDGSRMRGRLAALALTLRAGSARVGSARVGSVLGAEDGADAAGQEDAERDQGARLAHHGQHGRASGTHPHRRSESQARRGHMVTARAHHGRHGQHCRTMGGSRPARASAIGVSVGWM